VFEGKVTELNTDVTSLYKVKAHFPDKDNFRVELSSDGIWAPYPQIWALNLNTTATTSEIYFESNDQCNDGGGYDYYGYSSRRYPPPPPPYNSYGDYGNFNETSEEEVENNSTTTNATLPHLSDFIGWNVEERSEVEDCNKFKIWETEFDNGRGTTKIYKDLFLFLQFRSQRWTELRKETGQLFQENIAVHNDGYEINQTLSAVHSGLAFSANVEREPGITSIQLTLNGVNGYSWATSGPYYPPSEYQMARFGMEIDENQSEKYKAKLRVENEKIFDAWFYDALGMNRDIKNLVNTHIPSYLNTKSATLTNFILADITNKFQYFAKYIGHY